MNDRPHPDCAVLGGGVMGLSIAYELACHGHRVVLVEKGEVGREASWAGAGILPPPASCTDVPGWKRLQAISFELHRTWHMRLLEETGIHNGFRHCGGLHLARRAGEAATLSADMAELAADGVQVHRLENIGELADLEPRLAVEQHGSEVAAAYLLPDESQIRNPRHLKALAFACRQRGVQFIERKNVSRLQTQADRVTGAVAGEDVVRAERFVITAGAWSEALLGEAGLNLSIYPVRGQMLLYECGEPPARHTLNEGPRYVVPRDDGFVLVGSTEEDVGFDKRTTEHGRTELRRFAEGLLPALAEARLVNSWAGLRPHAVDGFPYLGQIPHLPNCYVAAGHYRAGLSTSTGTAVLMRQLMQGEPTAIDISEFRLDR